MRATCRLTRGIGGGRRVCLMSPSTPCSSRVHDGLVLLIIAAVLLITVPPATAGVRVAVDDRYGAVLVDTRMIDGVTYFDLAGLARAAGASRHWNATTRKMVVLVGQRRMSLVIDAPFAALDGSIINLHRPVVMREGTVWVPPAFLTGPFAHRLGSRRRRCDSDSTGTGCSVGRA